MSDLPDLNTEAYLGDGVYASFDGYHIVLRTPREPSNHYVLLEQPVYQSLLKWVARYSALWEHFATDDAR